MFKNTVIFIESNFKSHFNHSTDTIRQKGVFLFHLTDTTNAIIQVRVIASVSGSKKNLSTFCFFLLSNTKIIVFHGTI